MEFICNLVLVFWDLTRPRATEVREVVLRHKFDDEHENDDEDENETL